MWCVHCTCLYQVYQVAFFSFPFKFLSFCGNPIIRFTFISFQTLTIVLLSGHGLVARGRPPLRAYGFLRGTGSDWHVVWNFVSGLFLDVKAFCLRFSLLLFFSLEEGHFKTTGFIVLLFIFLLCVSLSVILHRWWIGSYVFESFVQSFQLYYLTAMCGR